MTASMNYDMKGSNLYENKMIAGESFLEVYFLERKQRERLHPIHSFIKTKLVQKIHSVSLCYLSEIKERLQVSEQIKLGHNWLCLKQVLVHFIVLDICVIAIYETVIKYWK